MNHSPASPDTVDVALFPIPQVVAFPGTVLPLHVFEPRYRQMVQDCTSNKRMIAVSDVVKTIHKPALKQTLAQALSSNQATYKPREVFSAGQCDIVETLADGRIIANIAMSQRLTLVEEIQSLPYRVVACLPFNDDAASERQEDNKALQLEVNNRLIELIGADNPDLARELATPEWTSRSARDYSFSIFQFLRFDPQIMQAILESTSTTERLEMIWEFIHENNT